MIRACEISRTFFSRGDAVAFAARLVVAAHGLGLESGIVTVSERRVRGTDWPAQWQVCAPALVLVDALQAIAPSLLTRRRCRAVQAVERALSRGTCRFPLPAPAPLFVRGRKT